MSFPTYHSGVPSGRPLVWLHDLIQTPPFSKLGRIEAGALLRRLQEGESLGMPHSRPMPGIGKRCHELRIPDLDHSWRIIYRLDPDAILILAIFAKQTVKTPDEVIAACQARILRYERHSQESP